MANDIEEIIEQRARIGDGGQYAIAYAIITLVKTIKGEIDKAETAQRDAIAEHEKHQEDLKEFYKGQGGLEAQRASQTPD